MFSMQMTFRTKLGYYENHFLKMVLMANSMY
jgi:hypothetical protein